MVGDIEANKDKQRIDAFKKVQSEIRNSITSNDTLTKAQRIQGASLIDNSNSIEELGNALNAITAENELQQLSLIGVGEALRELAKEYIATTNAAEAFASRRRGELQDPKDTAQFLQDTLKEKNPLKYGLMQGFQDIAKESDAFSINFGKTTTLAFRDGMRDALSAAISQTDDLGAALQNVAMNFLKTMQNQFLQSATNSAMLGLKGAFPSIFGGMQIGGSGEVKNAKGGLIRGYAGGGFVSDGSGYKDDVPAMLSNGEYVIRKSAVKKYGKDMFDKMNSGNLMGILVLENFLQNI